LRLKGQLGKRVASDFAGLIAPLAPSVAGSERTVAALLFRRVGKRVAQPETGGKLGKSVASPPQRISFVSLARKRTIE
jgi:hypothetical protein